MLHKNVVRSTNALLIPILLLLWFSASIVGTIANKSLMKSWPFPLTLSTLHMLLACVIDLVIVMRRRTSRTLSLGLFLPVAPIALLLGVSKFLTYFSYGKIPLSLAHTVKSSSPLFSMIISVYMFGSEPKVGTCLAIFVIASGVTLSAITEINLQIVGFIAALVSSLLGVIQTSIFKTVLVSSKRDGIDLHLHVSIGALLLMTPFALVMEGRAVQVEFSVTSLIVSLIAAYIQTIASMLVLKELSVISHTVCNTFKRLMIIVASVLYFKNPVNLMNALGMLLALGGFFAYGKLSSVATYQVVKDVERLTMLPKIGHNETYLPVYEVSKARAKQND